MANQDIVDTTAATYITPPELNWAVWSSLIHGAREIIYFNHTFYGPATDQTTISRTRSTRRFSLDRRFQSITR